jgi:hypothetical protein
LLRAADPTFSSVLQSVLYTRTVLKPLPAMAAMSAETVPASLQPPDEVYGE